MNLPEWPPTLGQRVEIISENDCPHHPRMRVPRGVDPLAVPMYGTVRSINVRRESLPDHPYLIMADNGTSGYASLDELEPVECDAIVEIKRHA